MDKVLSSKVTLIKGDITKIKVDAIVNAANRHLAGGGGVDGAIHRTGGPEIMEECRKIRQSQGGCNTGEVVITTAGKLQARFVIHTVGPVWRNGQNDEKDFLANCYMNSLKLAAANGIKTIAFPNISTGIYGFPKELAARTAVNAVLKFISEDDSIEEVLFVCFDDENYNLYSQLLMD